MKNNITKTCVLLLMLVLLCFALCACDVDEYKFTLNKAGDGYILEKYYYTSSEAKDDVVIPDTYQGLPVVEIENGAFSGHTTLKSVVIPEGVETIGAYAFGGCSKLKDVTIPSSVKTIEDKAFENCSRLVEINIPHAVRIGRSAFAGCSSLATVSFGVGSDENSGYTIGYAAFENCRSLKHAEFGVGYAAIDEYAFSGCTNLSELYLSSGLQEVCSKAFQDCKSLDCIYFWGTEAEMAAIHKGPFWDRDAGECNWIAIG